MAGANFEIYRTGYMLPHRYAGWNVLHERFLELANTCSRLSMHKDAPKVLLGIEQNIRKFATMLEQHMKGFSQNRTKGKERMKELKEPERKERAEDTKETGRIEAFSDGVFAVAITLLVLNLQAPSPHDSLLHQNGQLLNFLGGLAPTYLAFITSFLTIGIMWINHHRLFIHIKRSDNTLLLLNLLLLLVIVFVPFPTALMADYIGQPDQRIAALMYSGTFLLMAICFNLLWRYASYKNRLLDPNVNQQEVNAITGQYRLGPLFYIVTFALAFFFPLVCVVLELALAVFFAVPGRKRPA